MRVGMKERIRLGLIVVILFVIFVFSFIVVGRVEYVLFFFVVLIVESTTGLVLLVVISVSRMQLDRFIEWHRFYPLTACALMRFRAGSLCCFIMSRSSTKLLRIRHEW